MTSETAVFSEASCADSGRKPRPIVLSMPGLGTLWFCAWLFTIGFAHLSFWKGVLAVIAWPYFLGVLTRTG